MCVCLYTRDQGREGGTRGSGTESSSRAGEITHFDGIKMSVFPSPICREIAQSRARRGQERERKEKKEREREGKERTPVSQTILTAGVAFLLSIDDFFGYRPECDFFIIFLSRNRKRETMEERAFVN